MVDAQSLTWKRVQRFIDEEKADAVAYLIQDMDSEQQRGALKVLTRLEKLAESEDEEVIETDRYQ
jgi:Mg/Co/Ni transporter MgtE